MKGYHGSGFINESTGAGLLLRHRLVLSISFSEIIFSLSWSTQVAGDLADRFDSPFAGVAGGEPLPDLIDPLGGASPAGV